MLSSKILWSVPTAPFAENVGAFSCFGPFCILGVSSSICVVEHSSMRVVSWLSGGHSPQSCVTSIACSHSNLAADSGEGLPQGLIASGGTDGAIVTWILHEGSMLNALLKPQQRDSPREDQGKQAVKSICFTGSGSKLLVALYEGSEVVLWDYLKGVTVWQSCLNPSQELTHMVQCSFSNTSLCITNDAGLVYILFVSDTEKEKVQQVEYKISASDSKFMRCRFGMKENLLHIVLEHTLIAFDIDYGIPVGSAALAKKHASFQDILHVDLDGNHIICSHQDGSLSSWECNESKTIYSMIKLVPTIPVSSSRTLSSRSDMLHVYANHKLLNRNEGSTMKFFITANNDRTGGHLYYCSANDLKNLGDLRLKSMMRFLPQRCTSFSVEPAMKGGTSCQAALGTNIGTIEVVDLMRGKIKRSFKVHQMPVLGLRWLMEDLILSFSVEKVSASAFQNKLVLIDVTSGSQKVIRGTSGSDSSPLRGIRTSQSGKHFLLLFKNGITEIWRLNVEASACSVSRIRVLNMPFTIVEFVTEIPFFFSRQRSSSLVGDAMQPQRRRSSDHSVRSSFESLKVDGPARKRAESEAEGANQQREIIVFALADRTLGAVEISQTTKKLKDLKPSFPFIDIPPGEMISAISCTEQTLIVGTSSGELKLWTQSREQYVSYKLANWEGSARRIISDPCCISSDFLVLSGRNMFHRINVDHMPLKVEKAESNLPGTEILDVTWAKTEHGRQYVMCTKDGLLIYSDQTRAFNQGMTKSILLDPKTPERLSVYMQRHLPLVAADDESMNMTEGQFQEMVSEFELPELELRQAFESYKKFVADLNDGCYIDGLSELMRHYTSCHLGNRKGSAPVSALECMKVVASEFGGFTEEFQFWDKLPATLANVAVGNYGGPGCLWDSSKQKKMAAKSVYWHECFTGTLTSNKSERRVLEYFVLGDRESAIAFLLATSPDDDDFYKHALRALALSSFPLDGQNIESGSSPTAGGTASPYLGRCNTSLQEKASKVLSAHCAGHDDILSSVVILGLIGRTLDAVMQLQDVGMWEHASTMTASYLHGEQRQAALERWAYHIIYEHKNLWKGLGIFLSCGLYHKVFELFDAENLSLCYVTLFEYIQTFYKERKEQNVGLLAMDGQVASRSPILSDKKFEELCQKHKKKIAQRLLR